MRIGRSGESQLSSSVNATKQTPALQRGNREPCRKQSSRGRDNAESRNPYQNLRKVRHRPLPWQEQRRGSSHGSSVQSPSWRNAQRGGSKLGQRLITANTNPPTGAKTWLLGTDHPQVGIFTIQEHRLLPMYIDDAKSEAKAAGWSAVFSAARPGSSRGPACGGVAILAKSPFGLKEVKPPKPGPELSDGRWLAATVGGVGRPMLVCTLYGHVKENGGPRNQQLRRELMEFTQEFRRGISGSLQETGTMPLRRLFQNRFGGPRVRR